MREAGASHADDRPRRDAGGGALPRRRLRGSGRLALADDVLPADALRSARRGDARRSGRPRFERGSTSAAALVRAYEGFELPETGRHAAKLRGRRSGAGAGSVAVASGSGSRGLGASAGVHEGIARVVLDPADPALEFEAGDVLVAPATDPSWAPLFLVAGAVVIDTGSNISHARWSPRDGHPAVVAARDASLRLRTGQRLRVDGRTGDRRGRRRRIVRRTLAAGAASGENPSMLKIVIASKNYSSWSLRAWLALEQTGAPYEEVLISTADPDWHAQTKRVSPSGKVPLLIDGELQVHDSLAIVEYLNERFPAAGSGRRTRRPAPSRAASPPRCIRGSWRCG